MMKLKWLLAIALAASALVAQNREQDIKFRLAQSYEQSGDFESAVKLFEQVLAKDSSNFIVLDALNRDYTQLKRYDDAIRLLQRTIERSPNDILMVSRLGSLYTLKGDEQKAGAAWNRAVAVDPTHESTYRTVAASMMESRLFDRAIEIYQRGRASCGNPAAYTNDIAY